MVKISSAFIIRFVISFFYAILFLYVNEIFPSSARGTGFGIASAIGALSSSLGNIIITTLQANDMSPHFMNVPYAIIAMLALSFLP